MNERSRVLEQLGDELERVARGNLAQSGARLAPRRLSIAIVVMLLFVFAAAATAAVLWIQQGAPISAPKAQDLQSSGVPLPGSVHLAGLDAPDPQPGAPSWDLRISRTRAGETCSAVGQVLADQFGIVGLDHVFRAEPLGSVDSCGVSSPSGPILAGARVFVGTRVQEARTVVNGVAGQGAQSVTVYGPGGARQLPLGPQGSFITVYRGYVEEVRPRVLVRMRDGARHAIAFAQSSAFEVADPAGASPWQVSGEADLEPGADPEENCAQASQQVGRTNPSQFETPLTPQVCGRLGQQPLFVLMRRFVPGSGENTDFPWGNSPARTLVYGAAAPRVESLTLTGAGPARTLPIDPHDGVFLAVLDGHVDPHALELTAHLRDGRTVSYTRSSNLLSPRANRSLPQAPVPAYRTPLPRRQAEPPPPDIPIGATVRATVRVPDPADGPAWELRSWQARANPRASFGGQPPKRFVCLQVGVIDGHKLLRPRPGSTPLQLDVGQDYGLGGGCDSPSSLVRFGALAEVTTYLADPYGYSPRPLRTVVSGLLRLDATHPVLLGAGAPRPLALDANHAFLAVLPGRYWHAPLRIFAKLHGRTVAASAVQSFPGPPAPSVPQARAPDPNGGAPWGFAAGRDNSTAFGRIVEGRLAEINEQGGTLRNAPQGWSGGGVVPLRSRRPPVQFDTQGGPEASLPGQSSGALPPPEVQRRTLPGRTIVTGTANANVVSITIATPSDVRTLRPSGPAHAFIVVYDGQFFHGAITATVELRGGRAVTEQVPNGPGGDTGTSAPAVPSLASRLSGTRLQLAQERRHPRRLPRSAPKTPSLAAIVRVIEARIAYERTDPGVLPSE